LGSVSGIRIYLHWSFFLLLTYLVVSELMNSGSWIASLQLTLFVLSVFATVVLHELGHALTAKRYGCRTKDIVLLPIGGVARMERLPEAPSQEIKVALAGPAVNVLLAALTYLLFFRTTPLPVASSLSKPDAVSWPAHFFYANLILALFNLLPAFPMDGGRVLRGLLSLRMERLAATQVAARLGQVMALLMFFAGIFYNPMLVFIGLFIFFGAQMEADYLLGRSMLKGATVGDVMMRPLATIPAGVTVGEAGKVLLDSQSSRFIVVEGSNPVGTIDRKILLHSLEEFGPDKPVNQCMRSGLPVSEYDESLEEVYNRMQSGSDQLILVKKGAAIEGYVDLENILEFILLRKAAMKGRRFEVYP
jgi:Zn-dependent protease/predicted transcriptional regulator